MPSRSIAIHLSPVPGILLGFLLADSLRSQAPLGPSATHRALRLDRAELERRLEDVPHVSRDDRGLWIVRKSGARVRVVGAVGSEPLVVLDDRRVIRLDESVCDAPDRPSMLDVAIRLTDTIPEPANSGWIATAYHEPLLGVYMMAQYRLFTDYGVLEPLRLADRDPQHVTDEECTQLIGEIDASDLLQPAKESLVRSVATCFLSESGLEKIASRLQEDEDVPDEAFVRRYLAHGELRSILKSSTLCARLEEKLRTQQRARPARAWRGNGRSYVELTNDFGDGARVLHERDRTVVVSSLALDFDEVVDCSIAVELPPRGDLLDLGRARAATLYHEGKVTLRWKQGESLSVVDPDRWHEITRPSRRELRGWLPPHIPLMNLEGRLHGLVTRHGICTAPGIEHTGSAWIEHAARMLPDAWHLDLIRVWFFEYIYDSPDPRYPRIPGTEYIHGDIHQTTRQTLATSLDGFVRGDCDDLAELFQEIHLAQGKLGHILSVPGHAAYGFCEKQGRLWYAQALHTYEPVRFRARSLDAAVQRLYKFFDPGSKTETAQLPILLRFAGENQRDTWRLGARIFEDAEYARVMTSLQRDWHYHAFARAADVMKTRIESGDSSIPDRLEYAGLLERSGQWKKAARQLETIAQDFADPECEVALRRVATLFEAGEVEAAYAVVDALRKDALPRLKRAGIGYFGPVFILANALLELDGGPRAIETCLSICSNELSALRKGFRVTAGWLTSRSFDSEMWHYSPFHEDMRQGQRMWVALATQLLDTIDEDDPIWRGRRAMFAREVETWIQKILPWDLDERDELLERMALVGDYLASIGVPEFEARVDRADTPKQSAVPATSAEDDAPRKRRKPWKQELDRDLRWLKICLPWHLTRFERTVREAVRARRKSLPSSPTGVVDRLAPTLRRVEIAWPEVRARYPGAAAWYRAGVEASRYQVALLRGDVDAQRAILGRVKEAGDKFLVDETIASIGDLAPLLDRERFATGLSVFADVLDYRPLWFHIVWTAYRSGAASRARQAADFACERHAGDTIFRAERSALLGLLGLE